MPGIFDRTAMLIGRHGLKKLEQSRVAVFGLGGVGSFVVEGLARAGVGNFYLVDYDLVDITNINRQLHALTSTIGRSKVELMAERVIQINQGARVTPVQVRYVPGDGANIFSEGLDYLIDAIDDIPAKVDLIYQSLNRGIKTISAMGAGNKLDPGKFQITDISRTTTCPLARAVRKKLAAFGIKTGLKVIFSTERPVKPEENAVRYDEMNIVPKRVIQGSISFVPSVAGLMIAGEVVRDLACRD